MVKETNHILVQGSIYVPENVEGVILREADKGKPHEQLEDYVCYDCGHPEELHGLHGMWQHCKQCADEGRVGVGGLGRERILNWGFFLPKEEYEKYIAHKGGHQTVFTPIGLAQYHNQEAESYARRERIRRGR
jgi:hypothetical protein